MADGDSVHSDVTSEDSVITFNVYDRAIEEQGFLGTVQIKPVLIHDHTVDQWYKLSFFPPLQPGYRRLHMPRIINLRPLLLFQTEAI
jgi:hypothetical protein